jgi:uncharacterized protein YoxC
MAADQNPVQAGVNEVKLVEESLKQLWEKTRIAGELIARLRDQNAKLESRTSELETELSTLRADLLAKEAAVKRLNAEVQAVGENRSGVFPNGERQAMVEKVKDLLARLDSYL